MKLYDLQKEMEIGGVKQQGYWFWALLSVLLFFVIPALLIIGISSVIF